MTCIVPSISVLYRSSSEDILPTGAFPAANATFKVKSGNIPTVAKPSLQYLLAVPSTNDSDVHLQNLHDQYMSTAQQYAASCERVVESLRTIPAVLRFALSALEGAPLTTAEQVLADSVDPVVMAALRQFPSVPPMLVELSCHDRPHALVWQTLSAVATLLQWHDPTWSGIRALLVEPSFLFQLVSLDLLSVDPHRYAR